MSYIKHVLQPGETIRYEGSVHWILYLPAIILALVAAAIFVLSSLVAWGYGWILAAACFLIALLFAFRAWFIRWMTEIAVTDRRVIYARGFIQRHSIEVHMDKIESIDVDQSMLGRFFDYGDVTIHGTGTTLEPLRDVDRPIAFRNQVTASYAGMTIEGIWHEETTCDSGSCSAGLLFGFRLGQAKWDTGTWVYCQNASVLRLRHRCRGRPECARAAAACDVRSDEELSRSNPQRRSRSSTSCGAS